MSKTLSEIQKEIGQWAVETFGRENLDALQKHLIEEAEELKESEYSEGELADCMIILMTIAHLKAINLADAIEMKMEKNKRRQWTKPDSEGYIRHKENG